MLNKDLKNPAKPNRFPWVNQAPLNKDKLVPRSLESKAVGGRGRSLARLDWTPQVFLSCLGDMTTGTGYAMLKKVLHPILKKIYHFQVRRTESRSLKMRKWVIGAYLFLLRWKLSELLSSWEVLFSSNLTPFQRSWKFLYVFKCL